ncbi:Oidioi.mRNA.OKI2018_I69.chr2.g5637.t1.cds [Oikopleura dioica]|uniref:Oidioi.mRNA.OKI2018_I69.chr2.g5637.t1.cds n=1 Tax=Oikopleura dioica TaxID=34765 RepID=A0ABN7T6K3_OIKDI|nr:Oidioi.mRNA.OKI2018_I69.chr2.g5637.t1.cds [Oikopleura dioica]
MSGGMYCNDDMGALVMDIGSHSVKAGFAGEEHPKIYFNNVNGRHVDKETGQVTRIFRDEFLNIPKSNVEIETCMNKGYIENWNLFEELMDHILTKRLDVEPEFHPILFTEQARAPPAIREKLGIVLDAGATHTTASAVMEGYVIKNAIIQSPIGGDYITRNALQLLKASDEKLHLPYEISHKEELKPGQTAPVFHLKKNLPEVTNSWRAYQETRLAQDWVHQIIQVSENDYRPEEAAMRPSIEYEFPNGASVGYGVDRFRLAEPLFNTRMVDNKNSLLGVGHLITTSLHYCENEIRPQLVSSVILTGGNCNLAGFVDRINMELQKTPPHMKFKIANGQPGAVHQTDRRFGNWIGGSIIASLPSFAPMWVSAKDYAESGVKIFERKCI